MKDGAIIRSGDSGVFDEHIIKEVYGVSARVVETGGEKIIHCYKESEDE